MTQLTIVQNDNVNVVKINPLNTYVSAFVEGQDVAESSKSVYRKTIKPFINWLSSTGLDDNLSTLSRTDILKFKQGLIEQGKSTSTVNTYLTAVRKFFEWLESEKIFPNIAKSIKSLKKSKGFKKDCLLPSQIRQALNSMDTTTLEGKRDYALFNLLARTGLRTIELQRATVGDIRQESMDAVLWVQGKGCTGKDDFVLLVNDTLAPINSYLASRGQLEDDAPLFASLSPRNKGKKLTTQSISRIVKNTLRNIELNSKRLSAHSLRHTAITLAIKGGASLHQVQAMARHADPRTTMIYIHNIDRVANAAERAVNF